MNPNLQSHETHSKSPGTGGHLEKGVSFQAVGRGVCREWEMVMNHPVC